MDVDSIVKIVVGWIVKKTLDWIAEQWNAGGGMNDVGLQKGVRRGLAGMIGSVVLILYAAAVLADIASRPVASGMDAVAAALGVALVASCAITFKKRRASWKHCRGMLEQLKHRQTPRS